MRISRVASILPMFALLAGCATEESGQKTDESIFSTADQDTLQFAGELALSEAVDRPEVFERAGELQVSRVLIDNEGRAHARLAQTFGGVPVFEGEAIVQLGKDGKFDTVTDRFVRDLNVNLVPSISEKEAIEIAVNEFGGADMLVGQPKVDMQIVRDRLGDHLTYRVQVDMRDAKDELTMPVVFVDAHSREIVRSYDNLETVKNRATYTLAGGTVLPGTLSRSEGQAAGGDATLNQAHDNAGLVWDYYNARHARDSFDGAGAQIKSSVHYSTNYVNAFWNGTQMVYGDGDGVNSSALTVLDVVGHEITHAVTERSSNLVYANESGALNEAMSDIFGAAIEAYRDGSVNANTWKVGEECWTPGTAGDSLRQMDDPGLYGDYDYYPTRYTGTADNGGVHGNSGIANLAFALMVKGGKHPRSKTQNVVTALNADLKVGIQMAADIFYKANTTCLTAGSTFRDARGCTETIANSVYGAAAAATVTAAWTAVGVPAPYVWTQRALKSGVSGAKASKTYYTLVVPTGAKALRFSTSGGTGDSDLYVRKGSKPTTASYTCRSAGNGNAESCTIDAPTAGATYHVMVYGYTAYSGLTYKAESGI